MANRYWIGADTGPAAWNNTANWSTTYTGSGGASVPTTGDSVYLTKDWTTTTASIAGTAYGLVNVNQNIGAINYIELSDPNSNIRLFLEGSSTTPGTSTGSVWTIPNITINTIGTGSNLELLVPLSGSGVLTKTGLGYLGFTTDSPYAPSTSGWSGGIIVQSGSIVIRGVNNRLGTGPIRMESGSTLGMQSATNALSLNNPFLINGDFNLNTAATNTMTLNGGLGDFDLNAGNRTINVLGTSVISAKIVNGGIIKSGSATLTLSNANNTFTYFRPQQGTTNYSTDALKFATFDYLSTDTGITSYTGTSPVRIGNWTGDRQWNLGATFAVETGYNNQDVSTTSQIIGSTTITKVGTGTWTINNTSSTNSNTFIVANGTVKIPAFTATGTGNYTLGSSGLTGSLWLTGSSSTSKTVSLAAGGVGNVNIDAAVTGTISGVVSGTGDLLKSGNGLLVLSGSNTHSGAIRINAGTVRLGNSNALSASLFDTNGAGALSYSTLTSVILGNLTGSGNISLNNDSGTAISLAIGTYEATTPVYNGIISGSGTLTASAGIVLGGSNTFTGNVRVSAGQLTIANSLALGQSGVSKTIEVGGIIYLSSSSGLSVPASQTFRLGAGTVTDVVTNIAGVNTILGPITLSGSSNGIACNSDTIILSGAMSASVNLGLVTNTLRFSGSGDITVAGVISNGAATTNGLQISKTGSGKLTINSVNTYTSATTVNLGTLAVGSSGKLGTGAKFINSGSLMIISGSGNLNTAGIVSVTSASLQSANIVQIAFPSSLTYQGNAVAIFGNN